MMIALLSLGALALLPGLLVVRAPWTVVPALSLAFWTLSLAWLPGLSRGRFVTAALVMSFLLVLLRVLPKHEVPPPPGWTPPPAPEPPLQPALPPPHLSNGSSLAVLLVALALLLPVPLWRHAPGSEMAFQTTSARLMLWRDGMPRSGEPLLPVAPFGAHAPAIATLASDLSALSGVDPSRSVLILFVAAIGLLVVGLFALEAIWLAPSAAVVGALGGLALANGFNGLALWGVGGGVICLAFALPAAALVLGHLSRSSAFAAGMLTAAALVAQPLLTIAIGFVCGLILMSRGPRRVASRRLIMVTVFALLLAAPGLRPAVQALSWNELRTIVTSPSPGDLARFAGGLAALLFVATCARPFAVASRKARSLLVAVTLVAGAVVVFAVHLRIAAGQLPEDRQRELRQIATTTPPLAVVCAPADLVDWVPALAGRAVGEPGPWMPAIYQEEWNRRIRRPCSGVGPELAGLVTSFDAVRRAPRHRSDVLIR